jgi:tetratricopeptide (TPR) repeat protein
LDWKNNSTIFIHDVKVSDNSATAHLVYGRILLYESYPKEQNNIKKQVIIDECIAELTKVINIYYALDEAYWMLGKAYNLKKDYPYAIKIYEKGFQVFENPPKNTFSELGFLYLKNNQFKEAIPTLDSAIKYEPTNARNFYYKGAALAGMGKYNEAVPDLLKSLEMDPNNEDLNKNLGLVFGKMNDNTNAIKYLNRAVELDSLDYKAVYYLGLVYNSIGDAIKAKEYIEKAKQMSGGRPF